MNRNAERGRATREQLVDVATALFSSNGYEETSIEAVLREAGVSRGSLYHHFPSKDALFWAVMERLQDRIGAELLSTTEDVTDAVGLLRAGALGWIRLAGDPVIQRIVLIDAPAVLGWQRWREFDEEHVLGNIKMAMQAAAAEGVLDPEHADAFAHILLAAVNELALLIPRAEDQAAAIAAAEGALDEFLRRLLGQPSS
ncbi:MAG TPA: TetR/AcrR family transcriptional regulator [Frankiaceae bacterium]|jgi:AcrR family transcriptional regulator|nr:TetR/AcrR family transcriptional regulator [Frankiaceae bacterium]